MNESDFPSRAAYVKARIAFLRKKLSEIGDMMQGSMPGLDPEMELAFLEQVFAMESQPTITHAHQLIEQGVTLPPPHELKDEDLHDKLWEIIHTLAGLRVFLENTNHLNDRDLYIELWTNTLNEFTWDMSEAMNGAMHLDLCGSGSEEDTRIWLSYYASDFDREDWAENFPEEKLPEKKAFVVDRDDALPRPDDDPELWKLS